MRLRRSIYWSPRILSSIGRIKSPRMILTAGRRGGARSGGGSGDSHYDALLSTHDPGQAPQKGGLLYAKYGKGIYIYNAYAFYRQLPEGVPGAYRIFANMISLAKNPERKK